jgi:outer membrane protein assembly factor BamB
MRSLSLRRILLPAVLAFAAIAGPAAAHGGAKPETLPLPNGFQPEGIATYDRDEVLVGSIPTGALYRVNIKTGQGALLAAGAEGRAAIGIKVAFGKVFVAGGPTGKLRIQSAADGSVLREEQAGTVGSTFVNDVTVTGDTAYFTDSRAAQIYALPLDGGPLRTIALTGDFQLVEGINLNGIVASRAGWLLSVQTATGKLFRIDPATGATKEVDLGGATLANGDGLLLEHGLLSVVQNRLNQVAQLRVARDGLSARLIRTLTDPDFDVPTTITRAKGALYAVNARFGTTPTPDTTYSVVRVDGSKVHGHGHGRHPQR